MAQIFRWLALLVFALAVVMPAVAQRQPSRSPHGPLAIPCENCHTSTGWVPIRAIPEFNHDTTRYPLRGMHEKVSCTGCHTRPVFTDVGKNCADCHADIHRAQFGKNCAQCHTVLGWKSSVQAIEQHFNRFPLLGAHAVVQCDQCHKNAGVGNYLGLSTACESCHMTDFNNTTNPAHKSNLTVFAPSACSTCHPSFDTWSNASGFNHDSTGFLLRDAHATAACASCHIGNNYNLAGIAQNDCGHSGCHLTTWQQTNNPAHATAPGSFPLARCSTCHNTVSWNTSTFDHSTTGFLLTQGHASLQCTQCHLNNNYSLTIAPTSCGDSQCHLTKWQQTNNPVHSTSGAAFGASNCVNCHTPAGWDTASFNHSTTAFPLQGAHTVPPRTCTDSGCHVGGNFAATLPTTCYGCHTKDFNNTATPGMFADNPPNHPASAFSTNCTACHNMTTWTGASFNHNNFFSLTNAHAVPPLTCVNSKCHVGGNYTSVPTACSGCHLDVYNQTATLGGNIPNHVAAGFPMDCTLCHDTVLWTDAVFNHSTTAFPLQGAHTVPPRTCTDVGCHAGGNFTTLPTNCYGCHTKDFNNTATVGFYADNPPNHVAASFPTTCTACHNMNTWTGAAFNHNSTPFPLTGAHMVPPRTCTDVGCHAGGNYLTLPTNCYGCHTKDFSNTATVGFYADNPPNHITANFPTTCTTCHNTSAWTTATFNHTAFFPLTNAHAVPPLTCVNSKCHVGGNYTSVPTACSGCHLDVYNSTATLGGNIPNHVAAGFPMDCTLCHDTILWTDAVFNHNTTAFPLTGSHTVPPRTCTDVGCHAGGNYTTLPTTCYGCHVVAWQSTATLGGSVPNHITGGYPQTCASCHTTTSWLGAVFNHATTGFPLVGGHLSPPVACNLCHTSSAVPPTGCYNCHTLEWQSTTNLGGTVPNHLAADAAVIGITPTACSTCHTPLAPYWLGATFAHPFFPLNHGGNAANGVCSVCHTSVATTYTAFQCTVCHGNNNINSSFAINHPKVGGNWYFSPSCYGCHRGG